MIRAASILAAFLALLLVPAPSLALSLRAGDPAAPRSGAPTTAAAWGASTATLTAPSNATATIPRPAAAGSSTAPAATSIGSPTTSAAAAIASAAPTVPPTTAGTAAATATATSAPTADTTFSPLDAAMSAVLAEGAFPGGAVAVVRDGRLVYTKGYGWAIAAAGVPYAPLTLSRLASLSKPLTLSKLRQMIAAGQLAWTTPVFPLLGVMPADPRANRITVRDLAEHTSGLGGDYFFESRAAATAYGIASPPNVDAMIRWTAHYALATDPGATYHYLNTNYAILSRVMEKASGVSWIELMRGMASCAGVSRWRVGASLAQPLDEAHYYDASTAPSVFDTAPGAVPYPYGGYHVESFMGAVSLVSDIVDVARYGAALERCIPRPEDDPIPTRPGYAYDYTYEGSMPGHLTFWLRRWDGAHLTQIVAFFDARTGGSFDGAIPGRLWNAAGQIASWPEVDLFARYP